MRSGAALLALGTALALSALWISESSGSHQRPARPLEVSTEDGPTRERDRTPRRDSAPRAPVTHVTVPEPRRVVPGDVTARIGAAHRAAVLAAAMTIDAPRAPAIPERSPKLALHDGLANALRLPESSPTRTWLAEWIEENVQCQRAVVTRLASAEPAERSRAIEEFNRVADQRRRSLIARLGTRGALEASRRIKIHVLSPEGGMSRVDALGEPIVEREVEER